MQHFSNACVVAAILALSAALSADNRLLGADRAAPAAARPSTPPNPATMEKLKNLGNQLGRTLDLLTDLFSGNEGNLLSKNETALLSGNSPKILSGKSPKVLSENTTQVFSGNSFSLLSNIKVEIHIDNCGNHATSGAARRPPVRN